MAVTRVPNRPPSVALAEPICSLDAVADTTHTANTKSGLQKTRVRQQLGFIESAIISTVGSLDYWEANSMISAAGKRRKGTGKTKPRQMVAFSCSA